ncbi:unannotated protein [freshwater metagenome]|uniref:histidine kinase n=1 Tax=freshwater metagenome TaxID=449393 RepID=A0A6J7HZY7_9ZZZZ|nr:HAMP domain-containing protein [Actinomycetota bacterium]
MSFVLERLSIRWRLALISAALTFVILCGFAIVIGQLTTSRIRDNFTNETAAAASRLSANLRLESIPGGPTDFAIIPDVELYAASNSAEVRLFNYNKLLVKTTKGSPDFGPPGVEGSSEARGYLVETRLTQAPIDSGTDNPQALRFPIWVEYARPLEQVQSTIRGVRLFLAVGVFGGALLALLGGLALARRSLRPVTDITATARAIARTGDPDQRVPQPRADDEVAELARTFDEMLAALEASRARTEGALDRQRAFAADASHELRTPLTSVLANLELLVADLDGDRREAAQAALRSSQRMRHLVTDLLILARSDAELLEARTDVDLADIVREAAAEAQAIAPDHHVTVVAPEPVLLSGARDDLHRMVLNLVANAVGHTPPLTAVEVSALFEDESAIITVADDGPGIPAELEANVFERFVRAGGDRAGSTGLGLAIVRAVAQAHGGNVTLDRSAAGARFVVRLPLPDDDAAVEAGQTSTTTGSTIGRLRRRS